MIKFNVHLPAIGECIAHLPFTADHYQEIPECRRGNRRAWLGHATFTHNGAHVPGLRAVHLAEHVDHDGDGLPDFDELRSRFLLWNGNLDERVPSFYVETCSVDASALMPEDAPSKVASESFALADGTFRWIGRVNIGLRHLQPKPLDSYVQRRFRANRLDIAPITTEVYEKALAKFSPWYDTVADSNQQGSPGSVTALLDDAVLMASVTPNGGRPSALPENLYDRWDSALRDIEDTAAANAAQCGQRRLNYYTIDPVSNELRLYRPTPAQRVGHSSGLYTEGAEPIEADAWIDGGSGPVKVIRAWDSQHEFRTLRHAEQFAFFPDPLIWMALHGRTAAISTDPWCRNPNFSNGNERQAWIGVSLARVGDVLLAVAGALDMPPSDTSIDKLMHQCVLKPLYVAAKRTLNQAGVAWKPGKPDRLFHYLTRNLEPNRGHHDCTNISWQTAVQVICWHDSFKLAEMFASVITTAEGVPYVQLAKMSRALFRHGARSLEDTANMRSGPDAYAPEDDDGENWGDAFLGTRAYDIDTRPGHELDYYAGPGKGFASTFRWSAHAERIASSADLGSHQGFWQNLALRANERNRAYFTKADHVRAHDKAFRFGEAVLFAAAMKQAGASETGYR